MQYKASSCFTCCLLLAGFALSQDMPKPQPDDVDGGDFDSLNNTDAALCTRNCRTGDRRVCYYKFYLEPYTVLGGACGLCPELRDDCFKRQCVTANGFERSILTVNRRLPAPSIQVCKGDTIVADVINEMPGSSTSIHWHGIKQRLTPWMDGVPMVTQCPILEGQTFRYRFEVDEAGTYFWHSHDGLQKVDGIVGGLIVREPDSDNAARRLYDHDLPSHTLLVQDWRHPTSNEGLPGLIKRIIGQTPDSYLINGRGVYMRSLYDLYGVGKTPLAEFRVKAGRRYRFRIISGTCLACPFRLTFQDHRFTVIGMDDTLIEPTPVDSIVISAGERYDVVIEANQTVTAYWIVARGLGLCSVATQAAVLLYEGSNRSRPPLPHWDALIGYNTGLMLNPRNSRCTSKSLSLGVCVSQLRNRQQTPQQLLKSEPDVRLLMAFGFHSFSNKELYESNSFRRYFVPTAGLQQAALVNNVTNMMPPSPLLTQMSDVPPSLFCDKEGCKGPVCDCLNLIRVPLNSTVELIIADTSPPSIARITHPFHIHGHDFYILEQGVFQESFTNSLKGLQTRLSQQRNISRWLPSKDTVNVPATGYAVVRILADNPGFWLFHCHFAYHLAAGMSAVIQVGETKDIPTPPTDFPRCQQYMPSINNSLNSLR